MIRKYEIARQEKLSELGFVCYNRYSDGAIKSPLFRNGFYSIRTTMDKLLVARDQMRSLELASKYDQRLRSDLLDFGCVCYSLYVDGEISDPYLSAICENIKQLNKSIMVLKNSPAVKAYNESVVYQKDIGTDETDYSVVINHNVDLGVRKASGGSELRLGTSGLRSDYRSSHRGSSRRGSVRSSHSGSSKERLKVTLPYGMEPIPDEYIRCRCGYRNRSDAVFCAKCGRVL